MKYIVTGGTGFIGSALTKRLLDDGDEVVVIDNYSSSGGELLADHTSNPSLEILRGDISYIKTQTDLHQKLTKAFEGVDTVFHLAARARVQPSIEEPVLFNATNVEGTLNMLEYSRHAKVRRFVFTSSSSIYGDTTMFPTPETAPKTPLSPYGLQKLIGEQYCQLYSRIHDLETVCLRYFNVYGENFPTSGAYCLVMGNFSQQLKKGEDLKIYGDGEQRRDFTYVQDVVQANMLASTSPKVGKGEGLNIGNGDNRSINDIAKIFIDHAKTTRPEAKIDYLPARTEPLVTLADNTEAKNLLGWSPSGNVEEWLSNYLK